MSVILFIIILAVLIFVHELGHFLIAKLSGIRVDEFALGFPPTIFQKKVGETTYKLNIIPFGGYVSIFGENPDDESLTGSDSSRSMANKNRGIQAAVLLAGVTFNVIFAWVLISIALGLGISPTASVSANAGYEKAGKVIVSSVVKDSPAEKAGLLAGDVIFEAQSPEKTISGDSLSIEAVQDLISSDLKSESLIISIYRNNNPQEITITPAAGIISDKPAIGIAMESDAVIKVPWYMAPWEGLRTTWNAMSLTAGGLWGFIVDAFKGKAAFGEVSGPVGIVGMVGSASQAGFSYFLFFAALISINLAIINVLPFPALDGGRLVFVLIESITRRRINPKIGNALNAGGFIILILLMVVVTYHDILKLFVK